MMKRIILIIIVTIICSCYYFPIELRAMPGVNSKMVVAALGLLVFVWNHVKHHTPAIRQEMLPVLLWGLLFSLSSYFSVVYNSTSDFVYATYFVSMCVWLGGAYFVVSLLRWMYGQVTLKVVFTYLALTCAMQCVLAVVIDNIPAFAVLVDNIFVQPDLEYFEKNPRLYGIGASFDTAGIRFSCVLLSTAYLIKNASSHAQKNFYIVLFLIIGSIGNMISRTTIVGLAVACVYLILTSTSWLKAQITSKNIARFVGACAILGCLIYAGNYLYSHSPGFQKAFDYGFEGFINLYQTGTFSTHSSDLLVQSLGYILPDNAKTWLIGDGYFADPNDPSAFYMGTDMGYIRLIFYCGLLGLAFFLVYFFCCTYVLCKREKNLTLFFICLLIVQFIVWIKIPTDIFCFYALVLLADGEKATIGVPSSKPLFKQTYI